MDAQHTKHVTYKLAYHFVWCPKYRKKILVGKIATFLEPEIRRICAENAWPIGAVNIQPDHVHLFLSAPASTAPSQIAHTLKGTTARKVFQQFPEVKKQLWGGAFWSRSYKGGYRFDRMTFKDPFDILGFFLGYMSGPIITESAEEREEHQSRIATLPERAGRAGIAL